MWAEALGANLWGPFRGGRGGGGRLEEGQFVGAEAVGADSSRVDMWNRNDCCLETEKKCSGMESDSRLSN